MTTIIELYPEDLDSDCDEICDYSLFDAETFQEAERLALKHGGEVYTMIDGEGPVITYWKGKHYVNRIGICVLRRNK